MCIQNQKYNKWSELYTYAYIYTHVCTQCTYILQSYKSQSAISHFSTNFKIQLSKSNLFKQIFCAILTGNSLMVYSSVPTFNEWPTIFYYSNSVTTYISILIHKCSSNMYGTCMHTVPLKDNASFVRVQLECIVCKLIEQCAIVCSNLHRTVSYLHKRAIQI